VIGVLIVDDDFMVAKVHAGFVSALDGFEVVGTASSGTQALAEVARLRPDLVLLDVRMPGMDGIETARRLAQIVPDAFVVLVSLETAAELAAVAPVGVGAQVRKQDLSVRTLPALWAARAAG